MPILSCDLSQLEWRVAVWFAQDKIGMEEIENDVDFHADNAIKLLGAEVGAKDFKEKRTAAKTVGFGILYGKTAAGFAKDVNFPLHSKSKCQAVIDGFYSKYSGIARKHKEWEEEVRRTGRIVQPSGRILAFKRFKQYDGRMDYNLSQVKNYPVQSFATADIVPLACVVANERIRRAGLPALFLFPVHDSLVFDVPKEAVFETASTVISTFRDLPSLIERYWGIEFNVPLDGEAEVGVTYGSCKKISV